LIDRAAAGALRQEKQRERLGKKPGTATPHVRVSQADRPVTPSIHRPSAKA